MTKHNISISVSGVNLGESPSTTVSITKWVSNYDDFLHLCTDLWLTLGGSLEDDGEAYAVGLLTGSDS